MKLTKEQVEMIKSSSENATLKHGYDMTIIELCTDWLDMYGGLDFVEDDVCIGGIDVTLWRQKKSN